MPSGGIAAYPSHVGADEELPSSRVGADFVFAHTPKSISRSSTQCNSHKLNLLRSVARAGGDQIVKRVYTRISDLSFIPIPWGEPLHAIHYDPGQYFRGHLDVHAAPGRPTSSRVATCFIYMSDVESGGETYFPMAKKADGGWGAHSWPPTLLH